MTRWLYEDGIGEERALQIERGKIIRARLQRNSGNIGLGAVIDARLIGRRGDGNRGLVALQDGTEAELKAIPSATAEGALLRCEVVREAMIEPITSQLGGAPRVKPMRLVTVSVDTPLRPAPRLIERIEQQGGEIVRCHGAGEDHLADAGWHEVMEQAETGHIAFSGGSLIIQPTAAFIAIDVDGTLPPRSLALAAAPVIAEAIVRLDLAGSIVIDFPTLEAKPDRAAIAEAFDAAMIIPCERTAMNGFGLMQIVCRKERASLPEQVQCDPVLTRLLAALRSAERDRGSGPMTLDLPGDVAARLRAHPHYLTELQVRLGRPVSLG